MNSSSLKPLQTIGVYRAAFSPGRARPGRLGLRASLDPEMVWLAEIEDLLYDVPLLIDLDRADRCSSNFPW